MEHHSLFRPRREGGKEGATTVRQVGTLAGGRAGVVVGPLAEGDRERERLATRLGGPTVTRHVDEERREELSHTVDPREEVPLPGIGFGWKKLERDKRVRLAESISTVVRQSHALRSQRGPVVSCFT